jgi:amino acid transporter
VPGLAQGTTYFLQSALQILYSDSAVITTGWFGWCLSTIAIVVGVIPNIINQNTVRWMLRACAYSTTLLLGIYWIWFPIAASCRNGFQSSSIFTTFYNGINTAVDADGNTIVQASDSYCWVVGILFGAWEFYGYDASVHLAEETHEASSVVARGMWTGTVCTWLLSIPTLALVLLCMQDFERVVHGSYMNNWGTINHVKPTFVHADLPP